MPRWHPKGRMALWGVGIKDQRTLFSRQYFHTDSSREKEEKREGKKTKQGHLKHLISTRNKKNQLSVGGSCQVYFSPE